MSKSALPCLRFSHREICLKVAPGLIVRREGLPRLFDAKGYLKREFEDLMINCLKSLLLEAEQKFQMELKDISIEVMAPMLSMGFREKEESFEAREEILDSYLVQNKKIVVSSHKTELRGLIDIANAAGLWVESFIPETQKISRCLGKISHGSPQVLPAALLYLEDTYMSLFLSQGADLFAMVNYSFGRESLEEDLAFCLSLEKAKAKSLMWESHLERNPKEKIKLILEERLKETLEICVRSLENWPPTDLFFIFGDFCHPFDFRLHTDLSAYLKIKIHQIDLSTVLKENYSKEDEKPPFWSWLKKATLGQKNEIAKKI